MKVTCVVGGCLQAWSKPWQVPCQARIDLNELHSWQADSRRTPPKTRRAKISLSSSFRPSTPQSSLISSDKHVWSPLYASRLSTCTQHEPVLDELGERLDSRPPLTGGTRNRETRGDRASR